MIAAGEANASASNDPDRARYECFPFALRGLRPDGTQDSEGYPEPLAPNWQTDGFARLRARLVAALLGVDFDDLWKRDRRRARSRVRRITVGIVAAVVILISLFLWIDLLNWKRNFANLAKTAVAQASEFAQKAKAANAEDGEADAFAADALLARRRATRSTIAALGTSGMLARPADSEVYPAIWNSGLASRRLWALCPQRFLEKVHFSENGRWLVASTHNKSGCMVGVTNDLSVTESKHTFDSPSSFDAAGGRAAVSHSAGTIRIVSLVAGNDREV